MNPRRLPILMLPFVLAVPAQADEHFQEYFAGFSVGSVTGRGSAAYRLWSKPYPNVVPVKKGKESLFGFGEVGFHLSGTGSGHTLESVIGGLRYRTCGHCRIEPFGHGMIGAERPHRDADIDAPTETSYAWGLGLGADVEMDVDKDDGWVKLLRFQVDLVGSMDSPGFDRNVRATMGFVFRKEPVH